MKLSLKSTIVLWYTVWMLVMIATILTIAAAGGELLLTRKAESNLAKRLYESVIDISEGEIDELEAFDDGIYLSIYNEDGTLLFGRNIIPPTIKKLEESTATKLTYNSKNWYLLDGSTRYEGNKLYLRTLYQFSNLSELFGSHWYIFFITLPLILLFSALGGYFIVSRAMKSLDEIVNTSEEISKGDDLEKRVQSRSNTKETKRLTASFNLMLSRLSEAFKREKQFTQDASHELRTPIAVIKAESEYALENLSDKKKTEEALLSIKSATERMNTLVTQLLTLSRLDESKIKIEKINLSELVVITVESLSERAKEKNITLNLKVEENIFVQGDETMLMRLIINLVTNAITYTNENGSINIRLSKEDNVILEVEDNGIGIKAEDLDKIFDRFYQADSSHSQSGTGLGLSMVKSITKLHNGKVEVESELGKGSKFKITLPNH